MFNACGLKTQKKGTIVYMKSLLILGNGGFGKVVYDAALAMQCFDKIAFLDDKQGNDVLGTLSQYEEFKGEFTHAYAALGKNQLRVQWLEKLKDAGYTLAQIIHPRGYISPSAKLGNGICVLANATVSANAVLHDGVIVNINSALDHDSVLFEGVHLAPGSVVKAGCTVERFAKIESGEVVFKI